jgi:hypothetical protein
MGNRALSFMPGANTCSVILMHERSATCRGPSPSSRVLEGLWTRKPGQLTILASGRPHPHSACNKIHEQLDSDSTARYFANKL